MIIRPGNLGDIERCERMDSTYATDYVWQMDDVRAPDRIGITFRRVRLPRSMEVNLPGGSQELAESLHRAECFLVADDLGTLFGYLGMTVRPWQWQGCIDHLVVDRAHRGQGVALRLMEAAERWARGSELHGITATVQAKNDPATRLLSHLGYTYSGYIDHYYLSDDVGLLYSLQL
ncbi:MAG: GNAT family N-acetyltransferase [Anaerolineae bacterium]